MKIFLILLFSCLIFCETCFSNSCHSLDKSALLEFKESFVLDPSCLEASSKLDSWVINGGTDNCCSWDGVECSNQTGNVIGLDIGRSCLYGSIDSNSSLFRLVHLQKLVLSENNFNYSQIPNSIELLSDLRYLDLSYASFSGQIPFAISRLFNLSYLDLSNNVDNSGELTLELKNPDFRNLVMNLTSLESLRLSWVNISSTIPDVLANFSSLKNLSLGQCGLRGKFPEKIFQLPNLQHLVIPYNPDLYGNFPEFNLSSSLVRLWLEKTGFDGILPASIENLKSLTTLNLGECKFSGKIPPTLGNLTKLQLLDLRINNFSGEIPSSLERLTQLEFLQLSYNGFSDATLSWVGKQNKLTYLGLSGISLSGTLLPSVGNLTKIVQLFLGENQLSGDLPSWLGNFTELNMLHLYGNKLRGSIPKSFAQLMNLKELYLQFNYLNGTVELSMFLKLKNLTVLHLTANKLTVLDDHQVISPNETLPKFHLLGLGSCNLSHFPVFLKHQDKIEILELGENNIEGQIPKWMWNMSRESLKVLNLSHNSLTGVEESLDALPWLNLYVLDLSNNILQDSFPFFPAICNLSSLVALDMSSNSMSGVLPQCIGNFSSLDILNFRQNKFRGSIPDTFRNGSQLRFIDFSQNQLEGRVPRSFANCEILEIMDLGNNLLKDNFPNWFGNLSMLRLLVLRSNQFHGNIEGSVNNSEFPLLRIVDLSDNNFSGDLPLKHITNWKGMEIYNSTASTYRNTFVSFSFDYAWALEFFYSTTITMKGFERNYSRIHEVYTSIDLSNNKFVGEIPEFIGNLKRIQSLNLSHNILTGRIPSSLGNMTQLESLDLSFNKLSGEIPQQLSQLTSLAIFDVSYNNLSGLIPLGNQFNTFENSSYVGNEGLCGRPLSKRCGDFKSMEPPSSISNEDQESVFQLGWKSVLIGYGSGVVVGVIVGNYILSRNQGWLIRTFKIGKAKNRPKKRCMRPRSGYRLPLGV